MASFLWLSITERFRAWRYKKNLPFLFGLLSPSKNDVTLDVGAGTGWIASKVARICDETFALEPNEDKVSFIKEKHPSVKAFSGTAQSVPFPEKYFDKIYIVYAFHHFPDQEDALEEFHRILKQGGLLLIHEYYNKQNRKLAPSLERRVHQSGVKFLDPDELEKILTPHGFEEQSTRETPSGYFLLAKSA